MINAIKGSTPIELSCVGLCAGTVVLFNHAVALHVVIFILLILVFIDRYFIWKRCKKNQELMDTLIKKLKSEGVHGN
jgi:hypothetical protein